MAFSTLRGRPKARALDHDPGTPELRMKHALGITAEPIDLCLERALITREHHWCGLHLRWLYTLRYGAPILTTRYADRVDGTLMEEDAVLWRQMREHEYHEAAIALKQHRRYEPVMRLAVFNELPAFLSPTLHQRAWDEPALAHQLARSHQQVREGLELLRLHWKRTDRKATI